MPSRVSSDYKLRVVWDEFSYVKCKDVALYNRPHVEALLRTRAARWMIDNVQNLCWTLERMFAKPRGIAAGRGGRPPAGTSAQHGSRIFLDITNTSRNSQNTGIQRVCRRLAEEAFASGTMTPTALQDGRLYALDASGARSPIEARPGDVFVILDTFWDPLAEYVAFATQARARGVLIATCFYDIVPGLHPEICASEFSATFPRDLRTIYDVSDICCAISNVTMEDLLEVLTRLGAPGRERRRFFSFHLGADFAAARPRSDAAPLLSGEAAGLPMFLSVGTVEPKKGYHVTLDALERLWAMGHEATFVVIGKYGWGAESVRARLKGHPQLNRRLFWFDNASDELLAAAYAQSYCFVQASVAEGFGIPVIEAAHHGLPVIASDIDVFREIGGDSLVYFRSEDVASLAETLTSALAVRPAPKVLSTLSWQASFRDLHEGLAAAAADLRAEPREVSA